MADPTGDVCPNFASPIYEVVRNTLIGATQQTHEQVATQLANLWNQEHEERVLAWNMQQEAQRQAAEEEARIQRERDEQIRIQQEQDAEAEERELEKKKPKLPDFDETVMIGDVIAPPPAQYALQKIAAFEYVELWYFSPDGCSDSARSNKSSSEEAFGIARVDDHIALRPLASFKASRNVLHDHELTFSQLLQAKNCFLVNIQKAGWTQKHIDAIATLYFKIEMHEYRIRAHGERVLLVYASRARKEWHAALKRKEKPFNIAFINENLLRSINEEIWDKIRHEQTYRVRTIVSLISQPSNSFFSYIAPKFHLSQLRAHVCYPAPPCYHYHTFHHAIATTLLHHAIATTLCTMLSLSYFSPCYRYRALLSCYRYPTFPHATVFVSIAPHHATAMQPFSLDIDTLFGYRYEPFRYITTSD
ncbi:hypothetical protein BJ138DRAFT_1108472 [Hygrophoropsis aurantiaca]|uniref:Uncharacterized protein n=1 Tax=Hygrophoropsis aurantiaca TaxID=72124 RepID=A0ACB8AUL7_9AGAM|nr:hypothetical protein BJ138DRAFT_1108472 [Hygrophoropsis aurantiaca]